MGGIVVFRSSGHPRKGCPGMHPFCALASASHNNDNVIMSKSDVNDFIFRGFIDVVVAKV